MKRSSADACTRMRERAQQSWPALPNTAPGAAAAAASRSASAKMTFADLPPSSSVTRLIVAAAPAAIERPTSVEPVKAILATSGMLDQALAARPARADDDVDDARRADPPRRAISAKRSAVSGVSSAGLSTTVLPAAERRAELPRGDRQREVPGRDQPDDAERLAHRERLAAGDRDRVAEQPLGRAGVVAERVDDHAHLAARVADRPCRRCAPRARRAPRGAPRARRRARAARRRARRARARATPGRAACARATASSTSSAPARGTSASTASVAGSMTARCSLSVSCPSWAAATRSTGRQADRVVVDRPDRPRERLLGRQPKYQTVTISITPIVTSGA